MADGTVTRLPRPPRDLDVAGKALWRRMHAAYEGFEEWETAILEQACRHADVISDLEHAYAEVGLVVQGSQGQPRLNQVVTELRLARSSFAAILGKLNLPSSHDDETGASETARQRSARRAAERRWSQTGLSQSVGRRRGPA
jgi:hypothetical protein